MRSAAITAALLLATLVLQPALPAAPLHAAARPGFTVSAPVAVSIPAARPAVATTRTTAPATAAVSAATGRVSAPRPHASAPAWPSHIAVTYRGTSTTRQAAVQALLAAQLARLPASTYSTLRTLVLVDGPLPRRGYAGADILVLRIEDISDAELSAVFIHELGHVADLGLLQGTPTATASAFVDGATPIATDDPSASFYSICWKTSTTARCPAGQFISGYGSTDPFEDFAESFAYYVLHGRQFRARAALDPLVAARYNFLRDTVFAGTEYTTGTTEVPATVPYDITRL